MAVIQFMKCFNLALAGALTLLYLYQVGYLGIGLIQRVRRRAKPLSAPETLRKYAAVISARNEEVVIGDLVRSLKAQKYPRELLDVYVIADNCTDDTAGAAEAAGATVLRRFNKVQVGKGYALDFFFRHLMDRELDGQYAGYLIFDADNLVEEHFVYEMNRTFETGDFDAITCYRNSKNYGDNWISAGYSIWFLREARFVNGPRMALGTNCAVSGTGFLVSEAAIQRNGGWPFHLLTEDIQFSINAAVEGHRIGYCERAVIYDEQPTTFRQAWDQRLRWSKGFYQVNAKYFGSLVKNIFKGGRHGTSCSDMLMTVAPGSLVNILLIAVNLLLCLVCITQPAYVVMRVLDMTGAGILGTFLGLYQMLLLYGGLTVISEWRHIHTSAGKKLLYLLTFPLFMLTYIPISVAALFQKVEWKPIQHRAIANPVA